MQTAAHALRDHRGCFDKVALDINDADRHIALLGNRANHLKLGKLTAGHLDVDLIKLHVEKSGEHGRVAAVADRVALKVAKTEMGGEPTFADDGFDGTVKDLDKPIRVFAIGVTTHRWLINGQLGAASGDQIDQFLAHDRDQRLGNRITIRVLRIGNQPATQGIRTRHAGLERWTSRGQRL